MSVVIDASTLVAAFIDDRDDGQWALAQLAHQPLAAPQLLPAETSNILRRLELSGQISRLEATASHRELDRFDFELYPFAPFADRIWELRFSLTAYDAWYVALAELLGWPLVTLDRKMASASGPRCEFWDPPRAEQAG
ncbi:type II toxin-antitoxin system VapC family toxin [Candidatus Poriferisodalis sp.]|uniref:type II toxin-antitoxin system VapC family toxin n=1 Tax=Candidatus Poriferisodalis sp. TaxID=3101277 RepID=UPI003B022523